MVLLDMLEFEKRNNPHRVRMWGLYEQDFPELVNQTMGRLATADAQMKVSSFYEGDVFAHFERFGDDKDAVFCCYAPTYKGGYERLYKKLDKIVRWNKPSYGLLDDAGRDKLLAWMSERRFLWYDDRLIEGMEPVMEQRSGIRKTVYLYSNTIAKPVFFQERSSKGLPPFPLAGSDFEITSGSKITLSRIKTSDLLEFKDAFLGKNVNFGTRGGYWAFCVFIDGKVVGFIEYMVSSASPPKIIFLMADFPVSGTKYKRLSKLIIMLAVSGETKRALERIRLQRHEGLTTAVFSDKPISMKYRGVLTLDSRGKTPEG
jgi:hypothetical protein